MQTSIVETKHTRELEYRAYVAVKSVRAELNSGIPNYGNVFVTYTNTGRTPGLNGTNRADIGLRETTIPEESGFGPSDKPGSKIILAPQIDVEFLVGSIKLSEPIVAPNQSPTQETSPSLAKPKPNPAPIPSPPPPPQQVTAVVGQYYIWGTIDYDDIFGHHHQTKFCFFNTPGTSVTSWHACPSYNSFN